MHRLRLISADDFGLFFWDRLVLTEVPADITKILMEIKEGDREAMSRLLPLVYQDLRNVAEGVFRNERRDHTLQPTALVHEAYLRLMDRPGEWTNREHFFRVAAVVMRHLLVNHARDRARLKRGGELHAQPLDDLLPAFEERAINLIALDEALTKLSELDARQAHIVELRFFAGLSVPEAAQTLGISTRTVESDWQSAKAWLFREISK